MEGAYAMIDEKYLNEIPSSVEKQLSPKRTESKHSLAERENQEDEALLNILPALTILLVEDNEQDIFLTQKAFELSSTAVNIRVSHTSKEMFNLLRSKETYEFCRPDLILLNFKLPMMDGASILREIKQDNTLADIPVIILSVNLRTEDIAECYRQQAAGYLHKPLDFEVYKENITILAQYWERMIPKGSIMH